MAIVVDATASGAGSGTSTTLSHTCSADATILVVGTLNQSIRSTTGVTYNGVAMTKIGTTVDPGGGYEIDMWYLFSPASGANDIVQTVNASSNANFIRSVSYEGSATSGIGADNSGSADTTSLTVSVTTTVDQAWVVGFARNGNDFFSGVGSGTTQRVPSGSTDTMIVDSNGGVSTGSNSLTVTATDVDLMGMKVVEVQPPAAAEAAPTRRRFRLWW